MFSVLILTLNEERDLPDCLASVGFCDDIVVLDSGSTDGTTDLARARGARVFTRAFDTFAGQRNFAQQQIAFRNPWVFHLDADERFTPELHAECAAAAVRADLDGFLVAPRMLWNGRWIPHCTDYPAYQARFVRAPQFRFVQAGHGQREASDMRLERLHASYLHELAAGGEHEWVERHRRYARAEAHAHIGTPRIRLREVRWSDPLQRRRALKRLSFALPFRPTVRLVYQYLCRGGFLDGRAGWHYCRLLALYESFVAAELRQARPPET